MYEDNPAPGPAQMWPSVPAHPPAYRNPAVAGTGLAVASLVLSLVAILAVVVLVVMLTFGDGPVPPADEMYGSGAPLTGGVPNVKEGAVLRGAALTAAVSDRIDIDGSDVSDMKCPDTPRVDQGVVTVCHGWIDDERWAVVVYFEDANGTFTLEMI